jgi:CRISPR-associated protein Csd1
MSALGSLVRAYEWLPDAPAFGYSMEKTGFLVSLNADGAPAVPPIDLREGEGKRKTAPTMLVPQPAKRTSGVAPNFLWDKTSYALGVTLARVRGRRANTRLLWTRTRDWLAAIMRKACRPCCAFSNPGLQLISRPSGGLKR